MVDSNTPNPNTLAALERVMQEMQHLVAHPRIQQRTWVAQAKTWLPILTIVHGELVGKRISPSSEPPALSEDESNSLLVEVSAGGGQVYVNISLADVSQVGVYRGGEPGHRYVRGAHSGFTLKDGRKFLTKPDEAQRIVDAMRRLNEASG